MFFSLTFKYLNKFYILKNNSFSLIFFIWRRKPNSKLNPSKANFNQFRTLIFFLHNLNGKKRKSGATILDRRIHRFVSLLFLKKVFPDLLLERSWLFGYCTWLWLIFFWKLQNGVPCNFKLTFSIKVIL